MGGVHLERASLGNRLMARTQVICASLQRGTSCHASPRITRDRARTPASSEIGDWQDDRPPPLLRQLRHHRRADRRKPPRIASALRQCLRLLTARACLHEMVMTAGWLAMPVSVASYDAVLPWTLGMTITVILLRERIHSICGW